MLTALHPDPDNRLADGVVVETTLVARLFGLKVLRIDGTVLLSPARVVDRATVAPLPQPLGQPADPAVGNGSLALARRLLHENDERLQQLS